MEQGTGWFNRADKAAYESRRDYIIAVKGKMHLKYPERVGGILASIILPRMTDRIGGTTD